MALDFVLGSTHTLTKIGRVLLAEAKGPFGMHEWRDLSARAAQIKGVDAFCLRLDSALMLIGLDDIFSLDAANALALPGALVVCDSSYDLVRTYAMELAEAGIVRGVFRSSERDAALAFAERQARLVRAMADYSRPAFAPSARTSGVFVDRPVWSQTYRQGPAPSGNTATNSQAG